MSFVGAKALLYGNLDLAHYHDAELADAKTYGVAQQITMEADGSPDPNALAPQEVVIALNDGRELHGAATRCLPTPPVG
jgi:hypothetical protein